MNADTEELLRDYVQRQNTEAAEGYSTRNLATSIKNVAEGLAAHVKECTEHRASQTMRVASMQSRLESLEAGTAKTLAPPPPIRSSEDSSHDLKEFAEAVKKEAVEGYLSPVSTPDERVAKVVDDTLKKRESEREFAALRAAEAQRIQDAIDRRKLFGKLALAVLGGGSAFTSLFEVVKGLLSHH